MTKEELYKSCTEIDVTNCEQVVDKINEITVLENFTDEQKLFAIHLILSKNTNEYISSLKNENYFLKLKERETSIKLNNMEGKYREHLEHSGKEIEILNHIIVDALHIQRKKVEKQPVRKRFVVKINKN